MNFSKGMSEVSNSDISSSELSNSNMSSSDLSSTNISSLELSYSHNSENSENDNSHNSENSENEKSMSISIENGEDTRKNIEKSDDKFLKNNKRKADTSLKNNKRTRSPRLRTETILNNKLFLQSLHHAEEGPLVVIKHARKEQLNLTVALVLNCLNKTFMLPLSDRASLRPFKVTSTLKHLHCKQTIIFFFYIFLGISPSIC